MLQLTIAGNIGKDAVVRTTQGDKNVTSFTVAVNIGSGDKKRTEWIDCALWGNRGDALCPYLTKGTTVSVTGQPRIRQYESNGEQRAQMQVSVSEISLLGSGKRDGGSSDSGTKSGDYKRESQGGGYGQPPMDGPNDLDDEIPF